MRGREREDLTPVGHHVDHRNQLLGLHPLSEVLDSERLLPHSQTEPEAATALQ